MTERATVRQETVSTNGARMSGLLAQISIDQDKAAFAEVFQHFAPRVKSYVFRLGADETMAEELAQQTMIQVWNSAHLYDRSKAAASTWVFRIARNLRIDTIRKERRFEYNTFDFETIEDDSDSPEQILGRAEVADHMRQAITSLSAEQAEVVRLSFYHGLSHGRISEHLGLPLGTVKSRLRLALSKLKTLVGELQ